MKEQSLGPKLLRELQRGVETSSPEETESLASEFSRCLPEDESLALYGEMGAGKTTFVRGLARGWKIIAPITSPTFNMVSIYKGERNLFHLDALRIQDPSQYDDLLLEDIIRSPYCLAIEWPENLGNRLPENTCRIRFRSLDDGNRQIRIESTPLFQKFEK